MPSDHCFLVAWTYILILSYAADEEIFRRSDTAERSEQFLVEDRSQQPFS